MGKEMTRTQYRDEIMAKVVDFLTREYDADIRFVGSGEIMMPVVDSNGEEFYFTFKGTIPRGKRIITEDGKNTYEPYNGYDKAEEYSDVLQDRANRKKVSEEKKALKEKEKERKAKAKQVVKRLNTEGLDAMIHSDEEI